MSLKFLPLPLQIKNDKTMIKHLKIIALSVMMGLFFASCSRPSIVGTWIEMGQDTIFSDETGFTLLEDGKVWPINMGGYEFQSWERMKETIIFKGRYTGTNPRDLSDTLNIVELTKEKLVLEQAGYKLSYRRK